jgi:hypothetical protein
MHILYVDDSGSVGNPAERFFVLGGVAVFERGIYHLIKAADECVTTFGFGGDPHEIELHGSPMYAGRDGIWRTVKARPAREEMIKRALALLDQKSSVRLFAVAIDKLAVSPRDPIEIAFEEICNRFNLFLQRLANRGFGDQRGLIVMDKRDDEEPLQALARNFRIRGGRWGHFRHLAEVPMFVDSRACRVVQLADLVAYATWRNYEIQDGRFFDPITPLFDADGGIIHGLVHRRRYSDQCYCPACFSCRQNAPVGRSSGPEGDLPTG